MSTEAINCVIAWENKDDFFEDMKAEIQERMAVSQLLVSPNYRRSTRLK